MEGVTVGVLGGGQLGRMMAAAAARLGVRLLLLDPMGAASPAGQVAGQDGVWHGSFSDPDMVARLGVACTVVTAEIEHVNVAALFDLESRNVARVLPSPATIEIIQDKFRQKQFLAQHRVPSPLFADCPLVEAAAACGRDFGYPLMLKKRRLAYDGRGNAVVSSPDRLEAAFAALGDIDLYAEKWVPYVKELAVMVARSPSGEMATYPLVETVQRESVCDSVLAPARCDAEVQQRALQIAMDAVQALQGVGIFGIELFLLADGQVLLNEIAPRPHNSGHYTNDACECDQFEQHLRAILNLPLGSTSLIVPVALMVCWKNKNKITGAERK